MQKSVGKTESYRNSYVEELESERSHTPTSDLMIHRHVFKGLSVKHLALILHDNDKEHLLRFVLNPKLIQKSLHILNNVHDEIFQSHCVSFSFFHDRSEIFIISR